jgi:hypothetical protein
MCIIFFTTLFGGCDWTPEARNSFCHSPLQPDDLSSELQNSEERKKPVNHAKIQSMTLLNHQLTQAIQQH